MCLLDSRGVNVVFMLKCFLTHAFIAWKLKRLFCLNENCTNDLLKIAAILVNVNGQVGLSKLGPPEVVKGGSCLFSCQYFETNIEALLSRALKTNTLRVPGLDVTSGWKSEKWFQCGRWD